ncbi:MAG: hypothetical protein AAF693_05670 [Bacteroidota bacterium]
MNTIIKKQAILQSLDSMNTAEMEDVLDYIKQLLYNEQLDRDYQAFKKNAMDQINKALHGDEQLAV